MSREKSKNPSLCQSSPSCLFCTLSCIFSCDFFCIIHHLIPPGLPSSRLNVVCPLTVPTRQCHSGVSTESLDPDDHFHISPSSSAPLLLGYGPSHLLLTFFNSPFGYAASTGTLTAKKNALWSLTEPTFLSIITLGASSIRPSFQEQCNKFDTDPWRRPLAPFVSPQGCMRIFTLMHRQCPCFCRA